MKSIMLVAKREFWQRVRTRGFLTQLILFPLVLIVISLFAGGASFGGEINTPAPADALDQRVGFVDEAGIIQAIPESLADGNLIRFADTEAATAALNSGEIDNFYVIGSNYRTTGEVRWVGAELPIVPPQSGWFEEVLYENLIASADPAYRDQLRNPFNAPELPVVEASTDSVSRVDSDGLNWLPFIVILVILLPLFTAGGYLFQGLVEEKSSRVMEILLVSLRPSVLLSGKMLGFGALALVQYVVWGIIGLLFVLIANVSPISTPSLANLNASFSTYLLMILYALGGYALYAGLMAGIGAMTASIENNRIWIFIITVPMLIPIYLWTALVAAPNGGLATFLSLFPFSSPVAMLLRLTVTSVPPWQIVLSLGLLLLTSVGTVLLMAKLFRAQTLLSGESLSPLRMWSAVSN